CLSTLKHPLPNRAARTRNAERGNDLEAPDLNSEFTELYRDLRIDGALDPSVIDASDAVPDGVFFED
ncbi:MAG: hypothetical protein ACC652_13635, partial [Acidimicrobiales bacterium]